MTTPFPTRRSSDLVLDAFKEEPISPLGIRIVFPHQEVFRLHFLRIHGASQLSLLQPSHSIHGKSLNWNGPRGEYDSTLAVNRGFLPIEYRSEEHTSELQSLMRISSDVFCLT